MGRGRRSLYKLTAPAGKARIWGESNTSPQIVDVRIRIHGRAGPTIPSHPNPTSRFPAPLARMHSSAAPAASAASASFAAYAPTLLPENQGPKCLSRSIAKRIQAPRKPPGRALKSQCIPRAFAFERDRHATWPMSQFPPHVANESRKCANQCTIPDPQARRDPSIE